ncbi:MAG: aminomethyl-transferring glycine dehydrogenase subunit GcvPA [Planctomycetes bacterium]|nr:aminomethyl-transferring glycine dehydrogenase subunit GcvPA [Planctomycetota bacterium]
MRYTQLTPQQVQHMLSVIGAGSIDELFRTVPEKLRQREPLSIPRGVSEPEILRDVSELASRNHDGTELTCFLGGGAYDHFIPTLVDALAAQTEFLTAYTPYQAEASQGTLQLFYEFQTMVCQLLGMEVANASLYELSSAVAEAVMMATSITGRSRAVVAESVHPDMLRVLHTYACERGVEIVPVAAPDGVVGEAALRAATNGQTAAVVLQSPNFYGCIEPLDQWIPLAHAHGALAIVATDPIACGLLKSPGALDADIVVAEGQALGVPLQYGGPYLGLMACREKFLRKMPGRVVGATKDLEGRRGYCLVLQTREQHIKRERATSNVCTNQGLLAVRAAIYLAAMGRQGIAQVASQCLNKSHYAARRIAELKGYDLRFRRPFFKEFVVRSARNVKTVLAACRAKGILAGVPLVRFDERLSDCFLVAVTEKRTKAEIDGLVAALEGA